MNPSSPVRRFRTPFPSRFRWLMVCLLLHAFSSQGYCFDNISFKQYSTLGIQVPSKMDLTKLPCGKTYQVNHPQFVLQFFFNNRDIFGFIFQRNPVYGILLRWCFFRSCEENPKDLNEVIAKPQQGPYDQAFFSVKFPPLLRYNFQGLEFRPIR